MLAKFRFTGTFIYFVIRDSFLMFIGKQPLLEAHKWANPSKMWVSPLGHLSKKLHQIHCVYRQLGLTPYIIVFFKEMANFKVFLKKR